MALGCKLSPTTGHDVRTQVLHSDISSVNPSVDLSIKQEDIAPE